MVKKAVGRKFVGSLRFYVTFIDMEAIRALGQWRDYQTRTREKPKPADRIFGVKQDVINDSWNLALRKAGLEKKERKFRELHFHTLRKFFRTQCEISGVPRSFWDFWMGHRGGYLDESYFRAAETEHVKEYRKAIPGLSIETAFIADEKKIASMEAVNVALTEKIVELSDKTADFKARIEALEYELLKAAKPKLGEVEHTRRSLEEKR